MKGALLGFAICSVTSLACGAEQNATTASSASGQTITRAGTQSPSPGPPEYFTGRVTLNPLTLPNPDISVASAHVTFEAGARSAWHTHPKGQYLIVTDGVGLTQEWGRQIQEIHAGDVVWCPPGIKHWHGATPKAKMTHLALTASADGKLVNWMEKVSDEQYSAGAR